MDEIKVTTLNEDGSISFNGKLNAEQLSFILTVGINFLMAQGATFGDDDEELPEQNAPTTGSIN